MRTIAEIEADLKAAEAARDAAAYGTRRLAGVRPLGAVREARLDAVWNAARKRVRDLRDELAAAQEAQR